MLKLRNKLEKITFPLIMGIVNITPDSFFSESRNLSVEQALKKASNLIREGADIIDIGGVSTRAGADLLSAEEELERVVPVIERIKKEFPNCLISIDTFRSKVAARVVEIGADMVNDVYGGRYDPQMYKTVAELDVPYVLMHCRGTAEDMQNNCNYTDVVEEVIYELSEGIQEARKSGVKDIIIDPGFGFAKTTKQNYEILKNIRLFEVLNCPILIGLSRKSMIYKPLKILPEEALNGTTVLNTIAMQSTPAIVRVHDVKEAVQTKTILQLLND